ncbi:hypothetical protein, partial [Vibrio amylolyticus]|uniref:hypothetical protein n=1 Tax=Vibrio amylolyticus TaxID=2847292 RepID=UPI003554727A
HLVKRYEPKVFMQEIINYPNKNAGALTVIFTGIVTLSTVVYAVLTGKLVSETRMMREVQTEPKLQITLESFDFAMHITRLKIQNIGLGPSKNLKFTCSVISGGDSGQRLLEDFTKTNFFKTGLRYFGPTQVLHSYYSDTTEDFEGKISSILSFKLSYESSTGKTYEDEFLIDMSELKSDYRLGKPNFYSMAQSLEKIQKDFHHISTGFKKIKVDSFTSEDRQLEREIMQKKIDEFKAQKKGS